MINSFRRFQRPTLFCLLLGAALGFLARDWVASLHGQSRTGLAIVPGPKLAADTPAAYDSTWDKDYPQYQRLGKVLQPCPDLKPGDLPPQDLSIFGGAGKTSFASVDDVGDFKEFCRRCTANKPRVMEERRKYMATLPVHGPRQPLRHHDTRQADPGRPRRPAARRHPQLGGIEPAQPRVDP